MDMDATHIGEKSRLETLLDIAAEVCNRNRTLPLGKIKPEDFLSKTHFAELRPYSRYRDLSIFIGSQMDEAETRRLFSLTDKEFKTAHDTAMSRLDREDKDTVQAYLDMMELADKTGVALPSYKALEKPACVVTQNTEPVAVPKATTPLQQPSIIGTTLMHPHVEVDEEDIEATQEEPPKALRNLTFNRVVSEALQVHRAMNPIPVSHTELISPWRSHPIAELRQRIFYAATVVMPSNRLSLPQAGRFMGHRDHTTVLHGVRKTAEDLRDGTKPSTREFIERLAGRLPINERQKILLLSGSQGRFKTWEEIENTSFPVPLGITSNKMKTKPAQEKPPAPPVDAVVTANTSVTLDNIVSQFRETYMEMGLGWMTDTQITSDLKPRKSILVLRDLIKYAAAHSIPESELPMQSIGRRIGGTTRPVTERDIAKVAELVKQGDTFATEFLSVAAKKLELAPVQVSALLSPGNRAYYWADFDRV